MAETHLNLVSVLNSTAGVQAKIIWNQSTPSEGLFTVRVTIKHPYSGNPIYTGFDVRGILITGASQSIGLGLWTAGDNHPRLLNADGWTRWWNPLEFGDPGFYGYTNGALGNPGSTCYDATLNAYKIFADALPEDEQEIGVLGIPALTDDTGRAVFTSPQLSRIYRIKFPCGISYFNYAVDVSWAMPKANPPAVPDDFPVAANCPEAWYIHPEVTENTLKYYPDTGQHEGNLGVSVVVYDWQGRMNGAVFPEVIFVNIHSTELFGSEIAQADLTYDNGIQATYTADLTSICSPSKPGTYWLGIEVVSSCGSYKQSWQKAPDASPAAYTIFPIEVEEGTTGPEYTKLFGIHAYVLRKSDGSSPAISDADIAGDIAWANEFYAKYGFGFVLDKRTYIDSNNFYNLDPYQADYLHQQHHDNTGLLNLYYVNSIVGIGGAFTVIPCEFEQCFAKDTYIVFDAPSNDGWDEVLSHELGHNTGMLADLYWLEWVTCHDLDMQYCGYSPTDNYCNADDKEWGNIMYFLLDNPGDPDDYHFSNTDIEMTTQKIDSQAESATYFHTHYPFHFKDMQ